MNTIHKYTMAGMFASFKMLANAKILCVQMQGGYPQIWALGDPTGTETRTFRIYGTGHFGPDNPGEYIGTVQDRDLAWHVFEEKK